MLSDLSCATVAAVAFICRRRSARTFDVLYAQHAIGTTDLPSQAFDDFGGNATAATAPTWPSPATPCERRPTIAAWSLAP